MSQSALAEFRQFVFTNEHLQQELRQLEDRAEFIESVVRFGKENGFEFSAEDVEESLRLNRREWIERWI